MGRPRLHGERTRAALLEAAEAIVGGEGLDALSVRRVAEKIGASTRAVYSVFGSKEALIQGLAEHAFELLMDAVDAVPLSDDPSLDLAKALVSGFRPFAVEHPDLFRLAFVSSPVEVGPGVLNASAAALTRLTGRIERAQAARLLPGGDVNGLVLELNAVCQGLASLELCGMLPPGSEERVWADSVGDLLAGLRTRAVASVQMGAR